MAQAESTGSQVDVGAALGLLSPDSMPDVDRALALQLFLQSRQRLAERPWGAARFGNLFKTLQRPFPTLPIAAALVLALALIMGPGKSLAAQFLTIFRVQDVTPITIEAGSVPPDLSKLGDLQSNPSAKLSAQTLPSLDAATAAIGFKVQTPSQLPAGLPKQPSIITVRPGQTVGFTFRADKARSYLASTGHANFALPPKFDGASLQLHLEPVVVLAYLPPGMSTPAIGQANGKPDDKDISTFLQGNEVGVMETKSPSLDASGVSADELRDFLLSIPGLPPATVAQLKAIGDWRTTLPVPTGRNATLRKTTVNGASGIIGENAGIHMILWVRDGMIFGAAGPQLSESDLMALATSLR